MARPLIRVLLVALAAASPDPTPRRRGLSSCPVASPSVPSNNNDSPSASNASASNVTEAVLASVNGLRAYHGADPLVWSPSAASFAQSRADSVAAAVSLTHDPSNAYGENLAGMSFLDAPLDAMARAIALWYSESASYDYSSPGFSPATGHFTQLVWRSTRTFGAGVARSADGRWSFVAFEFYPPGNLEEPGQFAANVGVPV